MHARSNNAVESFKKASPSKTYRESLKDIVVSNEINRTGKFLIHSIYKLKVVLNDQKFSIVRIQNNSDITSCLVRRSLVERKILKKRQEYLLQLSTISYGKRKLIHISKI